MPKFKILIIGSYLREVNSIPYISQWEDKHFESRAEAQKAYHVLIAKLEDEVNRVQATLNAVVENGHIVEVEDE